MSLKARQLKLEVQKGVAVFGEPQDDWRFQTGEQFLVSLKVMGGPKAGGG